MDTDMPVEFNRWWDDDKLTQTNPYDVDTPIWWAWEGWIAGIRSEREACAKVVEKYANNGFIDSGVAAAIRGRSNAEITGG